MTFLSPLWLLSASLIAVVIVLHTLRRTRIEVPSVLLWQKLTGVSRARPVLRLPRFNWLMLLQIAAILLVTLALARPYWGSNIGEPGHRVYLLDRSASMSVLDEAGGASRFEAARAAIVADLETLDDTADIRFSLISVGAGAHPIAIRFDDRPAFARALAGVEITDGAADWAEAARFLPGIIRSLESTELVVLTDDPVGAASEVLDLATVEPHWLAFGAPDTPNAGIVASVTKGERATDWATTGSVTLTGDASVEAVGLFFRPAGGSVFLDMGAISLKAPVEDAPGIRIADFAAEFSLPGAGTLQFVLPDDAGAFDNAFTVEVQPSPVPLRALYIGTGNRPIELALAVNPSVELFSTRQLPADVDSYDLVLADNVALPSMPKTNIVWVGSARGPDLPQPELVQASPLLSWDTEHPLSRDVSWHTLAALPAYAVAPLRGATVLVQSAAGPVVEARTTPFGREVRIASQFDGAAWTDGPQLPTLISRILDWTGALPVPSSRAGCVVGEVCPIPARAVSQVVTDVAGQTLWSVDVSGLDYIPDDTTESFTPTRIGELIIGDGHMIAVNAPAAESRIATTPVPENSPSNHSWSLWRWLLLAGVAVMVLEALFAGLGSERFLRPASMDGAVLGSTRRRWMLATRLGAIAVALLAVFAVPLPMPGRGADYVTIGRAAGADVGCGILGGQGRGAVAPTGNPAVLADIGCHEAATQTLPDQTDVSRALQVGAAMIRPDTEGRITLAADLVETVGSSARQLATLSARDVPVDIVATSSTTIDQVAVGGLFAPQQVFAGDSVPLVATIFVTESASYSLRIVSNDQVIETRDADLVTGANRIEFIVPDIQTGQHLFELSVIGAPGDEVNDRALVAVTVLDAPKVAIVTPEADWGDYFAQALALQGLQAVVLRPDRAPFNIERWLEYDSVVLLNTPAIDLNTMQQEQLEQYVRVYGKGLLILGGENSFGPGGYFRTPLEDVSPLSARVPNDLPVAALGFVLDRSGSMQALVDGVTRLDIAKEATLSAIELLNDESQVAVIVFDTISHVLAPMRVKNAPLTAAALAPLQPGGGTYFQPALEDALDEMNRADAPVRHIILMSDGLSQPGDYDGFAERARAAGITLSVVAIGSGADVGRLENIARSGGGSFHSTTDFRALPSILSQEAMMLSGEPMQEGVQPVLWADRSARFLQSLPQELPPIQGFVETTAKPDATVHLETLDENQERVPLMASWSYGNGSVLAFGTHGAGQGTAQWLSMEGYPLIWSQIIRQFAASGGATPELDMRRNGDVIKLVTTAAPTGPVSITRDGVPFGLVPMQAQPDGTSRAQFVAEPGTYVAELASDATTLRASVAVSYPARFQPTRSDTSLVALAMATGGRVLALGDQTQMPAIGPVVTMQPAWRPWVLLALLLFVLDLTIRYAPGYFGFLRDRQRGQV